MSVLLHDIKRQKLMYSTISLFIHYFNVKI